MKRLCMILLTLLFIVTACASPGTIPWPVKSLSSQTPAQATETPFATAQPQMTQPQTAQLQTIHAAAQTMPRWVRRITIPVKITMTTDTSRGYENRLNSIRVNGLKDASLQSWLNGEIESFEKDVYRDTESAKRFLADAKLQTYCSWSGHIESRMVGTESFSSGWFFSVICNDLIYSNEYSETTIYARTWNLKEKRAVTLGDLFLPGTGYMDAVNSYIRKQIVLSNYSEEFVKRPFTGIASDYSLFGIGPGNGYGGHYGAANIEIRFEDGNSWFTGTVMFSIPVDELSGLINPDVTDAAANALIGVNMDKTPDTITADVFLPDTHITRTERKDTAGGKIRRQEVAVSAMNNDAAKSKINDALSAFYKQYDNAAIQQTVLPQLLTGSDIDKNSAGVWFVSNAQEFGGFLSVHCEIVAFSKQNEYDFVSRDLYLLFDLATGERLTVHDIVTPAFYATAFYQQYKDILSVYDVGLMDSGYIIFFAKPESGQGPLYDNSISNRAYFNWDKWKEITAVPL